MWTSYLLVTHFLEGGGGGGGGSGGHFPSGLAVKNPPAKTLS